MNVGIMFHALMLIDRNLVMPKEVDEYETDRPPFIIAVNFHFSIFLSDFSHSG